MRRREFFIGFRPEITSTGSPLYPACLRNPVNRVQPSTAWRSNQLSEQEFTEFKN
jgi:hypothetical protein